MASSHSPSLGPRALHRWAGSAQPFGRPSRRLFRPPVAALPWLPVTSLSHHHSPAFSRGNPSKNNTARFTSVKIAQRDRHLQTFGCCRRYSAALGRAIDPAAGKGVISPELAALGPR
ncbi:hypothetical protein J6590_055499 [Homalodisca vitripennis]|nr:hypothetical protein J6590_055499 [Homalodisca vitripennis]